jgi:hypothetical protein
MPGFVLIFFEAQQFRARDSRDGHPSRWNDHRRGLAASRDGFARRSRLPKSLLDEAPDEIAHRHAAQGSAGLERSVELVWKINGGPHIDIFASMCISVKIGPGIGQVPLTPKPARITASRNVSQPVLAVPASVSLSDCLKA